MKPILPMREVVRLASGAAFGQPLISNMYRGLIAEVMVRSVLSDQWIWCAADWAGWDFEHEDGCRLEVKQSAARQTWKSPIHPRCSFGIGASQGFYSGDVYTEQPGRKASIYVFAHHPICSDEADHREPLQWRFYVLPEVDLPRLTKTISLPVLVAISNRVWKNVDPAWPVPCALSSLGGAVGLMHSVLDRSQAPASQGRNPAGMLPTDA